MLRRVVSALFIVGCLLSNWPVLAAESALDAISTDASVVFRLKKPKATIEKLSGLVDVVQPGMGMQVRNNAMAIGAAISNPTLAGVDMENDWWVAIYASADSAEPVIVYVIPATDLAAMKEALGDDVNFIEHGDWGVYTNDEDTATAITALLKEEGDDEALEIDEVSTKAFDKGDLSIFINVSQLTEEYEDKITEAQDKLKETLENLPEQATAAQGINSEALGEALNKLATGFLQGVKDTESCVIALAVSKKGIVFEDLVRVEEGSETDKFLQKSAPSTLDLLAGLPGGQAVYYGLKIDMASLIKFGTSFMGAFQGNDDNKDNLAKAKTLAADMGKLKFGAFGGSLGVSDDDDGVLRSVQITEVTEPTKYRDLMASWMKLAEAMSESQPVKTSYEIKKDAEKFGKVSADVVTTKFGGEDEEEGSPAASLGKVIDIIFGEEGMTTRIAYLKDRVVQTMGGGKDAMAAALTGAQDSKATANVGASKAFTNVRKELSAKANLVFLIDLPNLVAKVAKIVADKQLVPVPIDGAMLEGLELKESYIGFSVAVEPQGIRSNTVIPVEQLQGFAKIGMMFVALKMQGGQQ